MQVILLEKIHHLGDLGSKVSVKPGYARNFLFPKEKAVPATADNLSHFEARRAELEKAAQAALQAAQKRATTLEQTTITIGAKAGDEGKLFGSVGTREIAEAITAAGVSITKSEVRLPEGAIRQIGEHAVSLQLHSDVTVQVKINIVPSEE